MENKSSNLTYIVLVYIISEGTSFCEQVKGNGLLRTIDGTTGRKGWGCTTSEVRYLEQVRTASMVDNIEGLSSSESFNNLYDGNRNLQSKASDLDSLCNEIN